MPRKTGRTKNSERGSPLNVIPLPVEQVPIAGRLEFTCRPFVGVVGATAPIADPVRNEFMKAREKCYPTSRHIPG